jgi:hypothetical protein
MTHGFDVCTPFQEQLYHGRVPAAACAVVGTFIGAVGAKDLSAVIQEQPHHLQIVVLNSKMQRPEILLVACKAWIRARLQEQCRND